MDSLSDEWKTENWAQADQVLMDSGGASSGKRIAEKIKIWHLMGRFAIALYCQGMTDLGASIVQLLIIIINE